MQCVEEEVWLHLELQHLKLGLGGEVRLSQKCDFLVSLEPDAQNHVDEHNGQGVSEQDDLGGRRQHRRHAHRNPSRYDGETHVIADDAPQDRDGEREPDVEEDTPDLATTRDGKALRRSDGDDECPAPHHGVDDAVQSEPERHRPGGIELGERVLEEPARQPVKGRPPREKTPRDAELQNRWQRLDVVMVRGSRGRKRGVAGRAVPGAGHGCTVADVSFTCTREPHTTDPTGDDGAPRPGP